MRRHSRESDYFPSIANLCRPLEVESNPYSDYKELTKNHLLQLEEAKAKSVPMPEDLFKEWLGDE